MIFIYDFKEGIFTLALKRANFEKDKPVFLVLEEMSRANVAAVFGDLFQLLDRKSNGEGEYAINNELLATKALGEEKDDPVRLPSNLTIIGTVNTSDQNVFAMDNAFKRRFEWQYVSTEAGDDFDNNPDIEIVGLNDKVSWKTFYSNLNNYIVRNLNLNEDKQIGPYFIKFSQNANSEFDNDTPEDLIKNKLLQYLWEDVESMVDIHSKEGIFDKSIKSFSELYSDFEKDKQIFSDNFLNTLKAANGNNK
ncbi:AAA family ATPase [Lactobacillus intestinalis]|uniref:Type ii restriction-modification system restriction subunit n=1 Tax=Lactobacillus intestinalis DSM 6629 TaxID=1423761 RepID=A0ABR5PR23_9LACO|nr:AAA family ATPase [Lactobacillus intestinalis]KRM33602.1 type ii restriction-modification system restriction subunit [Lactobacillus intestinalis DSM 6629]UTW40021.1 AAA family ATPase [Lactobacillus intestinalis]